MFGGSINRTQQTMTGDCIARFTMLLGLEFSLSPAEWEIVFWSAATPGAVMPYADKMLDFLFDEKVKV